MLRRVTARARRSWDQKRTLFLSCRSAAAIRHSERRQARRIST